jgi:hypothetical protein
MKHTLFILLTVTCAGLFTLSCDSTDAPILPTEYYTDGEVLTIHSHTKGSGIPIVIIGDGFAHSELGVGGIWEQITRSLSNIFIRLEVIKDFADYFDVYAYMAESAESGVTEGINNKFGTNGSIKTTDFALVKSTIAALPQVTDISRASVMFICNGAIGGIGTAVLDDDGYGYAVCSYAEPNPNYWCTHEFAGHVFGWVIDEYCSAGGTADETLKTQLANYHAKGKYLNVAATNTRAEVPWKQFFDIPGYDLVGTYEGGYYVCNGIWRSESTSIMVNQNYPHFNAQSRYLIYKRVMDLQGTTFTFDDFLNYDFEYNFK